MRTVAEGNIWIQEGEKLVGKWIGLSNEELLDLYKSPAVVGMIKSLGKRWVEVISYVQMGGGERRVSLSVKIFYHSTLKS